RARPRGLAREVDVALKKGLANLPLDAKQRARARALAKDALAAMPPDEPRGKLELGVQSLASAVAYPILFTHRVPLTQAEVAGPVRVSVARLRGRFARLRAPLDLARG